MTAQRQERNRARPGLAFISLGAPRVWLGLGWLVLGALALPGADAATTERVVVNRFTGLAIEGFDPVAYFADGYPEIGLEAYEASQAGAVWRFRNEGNRASFAAHPEIYGPQFGGYDPVDVARGVTVAGNPRFWLIAGERLYLFGRDQTRNAFAADPERVVRQANRRWPRLRQDLAE